jgi:predicted MPP superfamily phosphohydrolase
MLEGCVASLQHSLHVTRQEEKVRQLAQGTQGGTVHPLVDHPGAALHGLEEMLVLERGEGSMHLDIREAVGALEHGDAAPQPPGPAQVSGLPLHLLAQLDEATAAAAHDLLPGVGQRALVEVQVPREIEDPLWLCGDEGLQAKAGHGSSIPPGPSGAVSRNLSDNQTNTRDAPPAGGPCSRARVLLPSRLVNPESPVSKPRSRILRRLLRATLALTLLGALGLGYASLIEPYWIEVTRHGVQLTGLQQELKIAHLTDLHIREWGRREQRLLQLLEEERPDLIVITGDTTSPGVTDAVRLELLSRLRAPLGVFAVRGNWEHWSPMEDEEGLYRKAGIQPLLNTRQKVAESLWLVGLDDALAGAPDPTSAFVDVPPAAPCIALIHSPASFDELAGRCPLVLAGHTHGGQVRLPGLGALWLPPGSGAYEAGWYERQGTKLYVSRGLGNSIMDLRFMCRPELAIITLRP